MKKSLLIFIFMIIANSYAFSQLTDSLQQAKIKYTSKKLAVNSSTAQQVVLIIDDYKTKAKVVSEDQTLADENKRIKMNNLIHEKVLGLKKLLTARQLQKILPTSEVNN
jgi:hypothetical protein